MHEPARRPSEGANHVQAPYGEQPCDGDGLQRLRREMYLSRKVLAAFAGVNDLFGVSYYGWPVESLLKRLFN